LMINHSIIMDATIESIQAAYPLLSLPCFFPGEHGLSLPAFLFWLIQLQKS